MQPGPPARDFRQVETWVFDLDNTLYPHHLNLWQQVDERIRDYIAGFLQIPHAEAFRVQKDYYKRYGTSMRGLMTEHGMKPDDFLDFVHEIEEVIRLHAVLGHEPAHRGAVALVVVLLHPEGLRVRDLEKAGDVVPDSLVDLLPEIEVVGI